MSAWQQVRDKLLNDDQFTSDENAIAATLAEVDQVHPDVLLERLIDAEVWAELRASEAGELRDMMAARRNRYLARIELIRALIIELMGVLDTKSHRAKLGAASVRAGIVTVRITDESKLAPEYVTVTVTTTRTPDKVAIKADIDQGVIVAGAELSNPSPVLVIRKV